MIDFYSIKEMVLVVFYEFGKYSDTPAASCKILHQRKGQALIKNQFSLVEIVS